MGCDIHLYREKRVDGKWLTADDGWKVSTEDDEQVIYLEYRKGTLNSDIGRNYWLFGTLAHGVREEPEVSFLPRGMPLQPSREVASLIERDGFVDYHNASHLYFFELLELREALKTSTIAVTGMKNRDELAALKSTIDAGAPNWDLLYPYCKWTNESSAVEFHLDVPAYWYCGGGIDRIISSLEELNLPSDQVRVVFWFDN